MDKDMLVQAKEARNVEELMKLAKANHIELEQEKAEELFRQLHAEGELSDNELDAVAGGGCGDAVPKYKVGDVVAINPAKKCYYCGVSSIYRVTNIYIWSNKGFEYDLCCVNCERTAEVMESDIVGRIR